MTENEMRMQSQKRANELKKEMVGHTYLHFKGGRYIVDTIGIDSEDPTNLKVVYHNENNPDLVWVRNYDMFTSPVDRVKYPNVEQEMRFMKIN